MYIEKKWVNVAELGVTFEDPTWVVEVLDDGSMVHWSAPGTDSLHLNYKEGHVRNLAEWCWKVDESIDLTNPASVAEGFAKAYVGYHLHEAFEMVRANGNRIAHAHAPGLYGTYTADDAAWDHEDAIQADNVTLAGIAVAEFTAAHRV